MSPEPVDTQSGVVCRPSWLTKKLQRTQVACTRVAAHGGHRDQPRVYAMKPQKPCIGAGDTVPEDILFDSL